jgi:hypothetical protein
MTDAFFDALLVRIAARLRQETTMTMQWIAGRLQMGVPTRVAHLLYWHERNNSFNPMQILCSDRVSDPVSEAKPQISR